MNTSRVYYNEEGKPVTLETLVRHEPFWAANRIRVGEDAIAERDRLRAENERLLVALKSAKPVYVNASTSAVRKSYELSGSIKHYIIEPHVLHEALSQGEEWA